MAHEFNLLFFNGFTTLTPTLSLASQAMLVAARAVPVPQREGDIGGFIAIHRKPHTVLRRLAVQPRTVFGDAPCLKLSVDGYTTTQQNLMVS